ncbi:putative mitochondrial carrier protein [Rosa chinensis]|uniref:Putative mitochondrial carrier protein n=1 Tax=Rosa chinensis TaxID=74649 RepID=A0A2P6RRJ6_ROSCH|nr:putative mitochondrial carrier protein [Rosa chinensis]
MEHPSYLQKTSSYNILNGQNYLLSHFIHDLASLVNFAEGVIAGGTAGVVVETALYPIDTIKTRLQAGPILEPGSVKQDVDFGASAIFVGVYEPTKQKLLKMFPENLSALAHFTVGACEGIAASLIRVVRQRMQTGQFTSFSAAVRFIAAKEGFKGLYAGYGSFLLRDLPFDAIQFCLYEQLRIDYKVAISSSFLPIICLQIIVYNWQGPIFFMCTPPHVWRIFKPYTWTTLGDLEPVWPLGMHTWAKRELNDPENAIIGAFAGALTGVITTPLNVIKTRLMVQTIVREEGPPALLKLKS